MICSIFAFTHFSPTSQMPHLTIQNTFQIKFATLSTPLISGIMFGIFGAGGNTGSSSSIFGIKEGNSGNSGGPTNVGILGSCIFKLLSNSRLIFMFGGSGRFGNSGNVVLIVVKLNFGKTISSHNSI